MDVSACGESKFLITRLTDGRVELSRTGCSSFYSCSFISLGHRGITAIVEGTFTGLSGQRVDLSNNRLTIIVPRIFSGQSPWLDLSNNQISAVDSEAFDDITVSVLRIDGNRLGCVRAPSISAVDLYMSSPTRRCPEGMQLRWRQTPRSSKGRRLRWRPVWLA